jgi:hypothetical protein
MLFKDFTTIYKNINITIDKVKSAKIINTIPAGLSVEIVFIVYPNVEPKNVTKIINNIFQNPNVSTALVDM